MVGYIVGDVLGIIGSEVVYMRKKAIGKYVVLVPEHEIVCDSEDIGFIIETAKGLWSKSSLAGKVAYLIPVECIHKFRIPKE